MYLIELYAGLGSFWPSGDDDDDESDNENGKERIIGVR